MRVSTRSSGSAGNWLRMQPNDHARQEASAAGRGAPSCSGLCEVGLLTEWVLQVAGAGRRPGRAVGD
jgi:hypothetical protein